MAKSSACGSSTSPVRCRRNRDASATSPTRVQSPALATTEEILGPGGPLSKKLSAYESRTGQLEMARAVEGALREERILFCEAGTGTGKTLAYLVPALLSGKKVIVSTATRALQEQIFQRDLPLIEEALGISFPVALMKGLSNYVCRRRLAEFRGSPEGSRPMYARSLDALTRFLDDSASGDLQSWRAWPKTIRSEPRLPRPATRA